MSRYFDQMHLDRLCAEYPVGDAFLGGTARLSGEALRALQAHRFRKVIARAWQVPFYRRRWSAAGLSPGDIAGLDDLAKIPRFSKADLMESVAAHPAATGECVCRVARAGGRDEMTVTVEVRDPAEPGLADALAALLREQLGVAVAVELAAPGATAALTGIESRQKPIRLIDVRVD